MHSTDLAPVLIKLVRQFSTLQSRNLEHLGLGPGQANILKTVLSHYGISEIEIARLLHLDKSTVSRAVKRLIEAGYLKRVPNPQDRRSRHLLATRMAEALRPLFEEVDQATAQALVIGFTPEEMDEFHTLIRRASANVHHVLHSPPVSPFTRYMPRPEG